MKKCFLLALICTLVILTGLAQDITEHKNVINLGLGGLAIGNVSLNYERTFSDSRAASLTAGFLVPRNLPSVIYDNISEEGNWDADNKLSGFFVMPEYRFYPSYKIAPEGFYIAPFLRLNHYTLDIGGDFDDVTAEITGKIVGIGGGVQFGMHWVIKERVSIDFFMAGLGLYYDIISLRFESDDPDVDYNDLGDDVEVDINGIPLIGEKTEIEVGDDYVDGSASFVFPGFRSGISIGIVF
jgi:hypothetical protein